MPTSVDRPAGLHPALTPVRVAAQVDGPAADDATTWLSIDELAPAYALRQNGEDVAHSRALSEIDAGLPPILVHRPTMRIIDGAHRVSAAQLRGEITIEVRFFDGSEPEAFALAVRANIAHGLPLSFDDRVAAATALITQNPRWSDRAVAATAGLSAATVRAVRSRLDDGAHGEETRVGRDGRVRPIDGMAGRRRAMEVLLRSPDASLRRVAREAGVSPSTVRNVRLRMDRSEDPIGRRQPDATRSRREPARPDAASARIDARSVLDGLSRDPSLRFTESGRAMLRWLSSRIVLPEEWHEMLAGLPPHTAYLVAELAEKCAGEWARFGSALKDRTQAAG